MLPQFVTLYNLDNGVFVIGIFILVCIVLAGGVIAMIFGGDSKKSD
jgi:hypothetical protein